MRLTAERKGSAVILFPNCKINLGLTILHKRADGYHDLETVFYPLPLKDALEVIPQRAGEKDVQFSLSGLPVQGNPEQNLCMRAWQLLKNEFPQLPPVQMHLHKAIPMGAGLGGGSADGAFALQLLNEKFHLDLTREKLLQYAAQLGSDCPFFIVNAPCVATGRGEILEPIPVDLSRFSVLLVHPHIHIDTARAFAQLTPKDNRKRTKEIIFQPIETWKEELINDFETPVCEKYPALQRIKHKLYAAGASYASMTGSGSCFFGLFPKNNMPSSFNTDAGVSVYRLDL